MSPVIDVCIIYRILYSVYIYILTLYTVFLVEL